MPHEISLWFTAGSTYTYLTISRLERVAADYGVRFHLRPFYLGVLFKEANIFPFHEGTAKTAYMWRDIARQAKRYGLTPSLPAPYPIDAFRANQVALAAIEQGIGLDYMRASYRAWFEDGLPPGQAENIAASFAELGRDPALVLEQAASDAIDRQLNENTDEARELGIFGSPSFMVGDELFWGDDRLEDAAKWAVQT